MNWGSRYIKKLMEWCPNAKTHEAKQQTNFGIFESDIPDRAKGDDGDQKNLGWIRKTSTYTLLINILFTLIYTLAINHLGLNLAYLLAGFFVFVIFFVFDWKKQMHRYDTLAQELVLDYSGMEKVIRIMTLIFYAILFYWIFSGDVLKNFYLQVTFSFMGGIVIGMWLNYFQLIYWQKKNHRTIYFDKKYSTWKRSYIIRERK